MSWMGSSLHIYDPAYGLKPHYEVFLPKSDNCIFLKISEFWRESRIFKQSIDVINTLFFLCITGEENPDETATDGNV